MSNQCTCTTDKEATCIVHPTTRSLKARIAELQAERKALMKPTEVVAVMAENTKLREALETVSRLEPYDGNRHVYHTAGKVARKALAALLPEPHGSTDLVQKPSSEICNPSK